MNSIAFDVHEAGIHADYVLFDSWFSSPKVIRSMKEKGLDVVAMVKKSSKVPYCFQGQQLSWDIEVFFKTCKSVLKLTDQCRSVSYDAMCAQTFITMILRSVMYAIV